jgi:hypothetical protein
MHRFASLRSPPLRFPLPHHYHHHHHQPHFARARRTFAASARASDFHFDTHHFVQRLEREGLNRAQAEGIMGAMAEVIDESIRNMTGNMVTKAEQEKVRPTFRLGCLRADARVGMCSTSTRSRWTLRSSSRSCS